jgi:hypothetical protein
MALKKTVTNKHGIIVQDAYHRVENVQLGKSHINYLIKSFTNSDHPLAFEQRDYAASYNMNGDNPWVQAYEHAKTQPEWINAEDC